MAIVGQGAYSLSGRRFILLTRINLSSKMHAARTIYVLCARELVVLQKNQIKRETFHRFAGRTMQNARNDFPEKG